MTGRPAPGPLTPDDVPAYSRAYLERAVAEAVRAERQHIALAVRNTCACQSCKDFIAGLLEDSHG